MHADLLPNNDNCDHLAVKFEEFEPKGEDYIEVSVVCKRCGASVNKVHVSKESP